MTITLDTAVAGLLLTSLLHIASAIWWASQINQRVAGLERWRDQHDDVREQLAEIHAELASIKATLGHRQPHPI